MAKLLGIDIESVNILISLGLKNIKIPSGEITNYPYLKHIAKFNKKIILSTGMSNIVEIKKAIYSNAGKKYLQYRNFLYKYEKKYSWYK